MDRTPHGLSRLFNFGKVVFAVVCSVMEMKALKLFTCKTKYEELPLIHTVL